MHTAVTKSCKDTEKLDKEPEEEKKKANKGHKCHFKREIHGVQMGTKCAFDNLAEHIKKGCFVYSLSPAVGLSYTASGSPSPAMVDCHLREENEGLMWWRPMATVAKKSS